MSNELFAELIEWLRLKRWKPHELAERVYPLRRQQGVADGSGEGQADPVPRIPPLTCP